MLMALVSFACTTRREFVETATAAPEFTNTVNINTATAEELELLPRIGPKTAQNIVKFREEHGPFRRIEHLMQIRGISEKRFREIRPFLRVE